MNNSITKITQEERKIMNQLKKTRQALSNIPGNRLEHLFTDEETALFWQGARALLRDNLCFYRELIETLDSAGRIPEKMQERLIKYVNRKKGKS